VGGAGGLGGGGGLGGASALGGTATVTTTRGLSGTSMTNMASLPRPRFAYQAAIRFPAAAPAPGALQANLQGAIAGTTALRAPGDVRVEVDGRTVFLRGTVDDDRESRLAEGIIRLTPGVRDIRNELQ